MATLRCIDCFAEDCFTSCPLTSEMICTNCGCVDTAMYTQSTQPAPKYDIMSFLGISPVKIEPEWTRCGREYHQTFESKVQALSSPKIDWRTHPVHMKRWEMLKRSVFDLDDALSWFYTSPEFLPRIDFSYLQKCHAAQIEEKDRIDRVNESNSQLKALLNFSPVRSISRCATPDPEAYHPCKSQVLSLNEYLAEMKKPTPLKRGGQRRRFSLFKQFVAVTVIFHRAENIRPETYSYVLPVIQEVLLGSISWQSIIDTAGNMGVCAAHPKGLKEVVAPFARQCMKIANVPMWRNETDGNILLSPRHDPRITAICLTRSQLSKPPKFNDIFRNGRSDPRVVRIGCTNARTIISETFPET